MNKRLKLELFSVVLFIGLLPHAIILASGISNGTLFIVHLAWFLKMAIIDL